MWGEEDTPNLSSILGLGSEWWRQCLRPLMLEISLNWSCSCKLWSARRAAGDCGLLLGVITAPASFLHRQGRLVPSFIPHPGLTCVPHCSPRVRVLEEGGSERLWEGFLGELRDSVTG